MEKETVTKFNLEAAFKALDEIEMPSTASGSRFKANRVNLHERFQAKSAHERLIEDYFDVNDVDDLEAAKDEREAEVAKAKLARIEKIVDLDAETEEDILPSYVGKFIIQCPQCMTLFYKNEEDIEKSEEAPEVVNINELCQHCGNASGYTLVGKVGGIEADEAENFEAEAMSEEENELDLDFPEEGTEEVDAEGVGAGAEEMSEDDFDLDLDFEEEAEAEEEVEEEEEEETNESLHNSELLKKIEKNNDLKTENESEHLTLNEEVAEEQPIDAVEESTIEEDIGRVVRKVFDKPASADVQQSWEDELNGEMGEISPKRRAELEKNFAQQRDWEMRHPEVAAEMSATPVTEDVADDTAEDSVPVENVETKESMHNSELLAKIADKNELKTENESEHLTINEDATEPSENLEDFEEFDEAFDAHITNYLQEVYSNIDAYTSTTCTTAKNKFVVEGIIKFKSGKEKATKFTFNPSRRINGSIIFRGMNEGLTSEKSAFRLACKTEDKKLITEGFSYRYDIDGAAIKGSTKTIHN